MKCMKNVKLIGFILVLCLSSLHSQIPNNFQFLDHTEHRTNSNVFKVTDDGVFFTSDYGVELATPDYKLNNKTSLQSFEAFSHRLYEIDDSTFHIVMSNLFEKDVSVLGYLVFTKSGAKESGIRTLSSDLYSGRYREVIPDSSGGVFVLDTNNDLLHILENGQIDTMSTNFSSFTDYYLYTNCNDRISVIEEGKGELYRRRGEFNYVCDDGFTLEKFDCEFDNVLFEWTLPDSLVSFQQVQFLPNNSLYMDVIEDSHNYVLYRIDSMSSAEIIYEGQLDSVEQVKGAHIINDTTHVVHGIHTFQYTENQFFRTVHKNLIPDYEMSDIDVLDYSLSKIVDKSAVNMRLTAFNPTEDTISFMRSFYDISEREFYKFFSIFLEEPLPPDSTSVLINEINSSNPESFLSIFSSLQIEIPGAGYKFLESGPQYILPEILSTNSLEIVEKEIIIYPNPVSNSFFLTTDKENGDYRLNLYDSHGSKVLTQTLFERNSRIDVSSFSSGVYFGTLNNGSIDLSGFKFIKIE